LKPIEGYYIETDEGLLFAVKGLHHPEDGLIAYLRYIPDEHGDRIRLGRRYRRVYDLDETTRYLEEHHPEYLRWMEEKGINVQFVPHSHIKRIYDPRGRLREILKHPKGRIETLVKLFADALRDEGVPIGDVGLTGSLLIGMSTAKSDIDLVIYGKRSGLKAYRALRRLRERGLLSELPPGEAFRVAERRWGGTGLDLGRLAELERVKLLHGLILGVPYYVRLVPHPHEFEDSHPSRPVGEVTVRGVVVDDALSIYTPCLYGVDAEIDGLRVEELMSYRGRFTEQVWRGDSFEARGILEEVHSSRGVYYRLMLGRGGDYLISLSLLEAI